VEKAISFAYSEFVFVALVIQHTMRMRHIVVFGSALLNCIFPHYLISGTIFEKEKNIIEHKMCENSFHQRMHTLLNI
jgi:hypothetical protein